jgi:hypothetical protein
MAVWSALVAENFQLLIYTDERGKQPFTEWL